MSNSPQRIMRNALKRYLYSIYEASRIQRHKNEHDSVEYNPQARLLDCGCREGDNTLSIASRIGTKDITGLDFTFSVLKQANQRAIRAIRCDLNQPIPLKCETFDVIFASNVIEHLWNPYVFVGEMYRVLRPGGYLVLDTPNLSSWHNIYALMIGRQPFSGPNITNMEDSELAIVREMHRSDHGLPEEGENVRHNEQELTRHITVMAYHSLVDLFERWGFKVIQKNGFGYYPFPPFLARTLQRINPSHAHHITIKAVKLDAA